MAATIGQPAPDFSLSNQENTKVSLADLRGSKAMVVFIPFPFTGNCEAELCAIRDDMASLSSLGAKVVVITCDTRPTNAHWSKEHGFDFPVLSDFWPHGAVAQAYGAFNEQTGSANRWTFVLDAQGVVRQIVKSDSLGQTRDHAEYAKALSSF
jgi:peroxiredoxin (alkyl hydroperoxide reductase subunit C)